MHLSIHRLNASLRQIQKNGQNGSVRLQPALGDGISLSVDETDTHYDLKLETKPLSLLSLQAMPRNPGRWLTLNFDLGVEGFDDCAVFGFALRAVSPRSTVMHAVIRTYLGEGHEDTSFPDQIVAYADPSTHSDTLWINAEPQLRGMAKWRTFLLFLEPEGVSLHIEDLRFFAA